MYDFFLSHHLTAGWAVHVRPLFLNPFIETPRAEHMRTRRDQRRSHDKVAYFADELCILAKKTSRILGHQLFGEHGNCCPRGGRRRSLRSRTFRWLHNGSGRSGSLWGLGLRRPGLRQDPEPLGGAVPLRLLGARAEVSGAGRAGASAGDARRSSVRFGRPGAFCCPRRDLRGRARWSNRLAWGGLGRG